MFLYLFYLWLLGSCLLLVNCVLDLLLLIGLGVRCFRAVDYILCLVVVVCVWVACLVVVLVGWFLEFGCCYGCLLFLVCLCIADLAEVVIYRGLL